jgi:hypothetical protein
MRAFPINLLAGWADFEFFVVVIDIFGNAGFYICFFRKLKKGVAFNTSCHKIITTDVGFDDVFDFFDLLLNPV